MFVATNICSITSCTYTERPKCTKSDALHYWPLAALMGCLEGEFIRREKAARCHKGIALSSEIVRHILRRRSSSPISCPFSNDRVLSGSVCLHLPLTIVMFGLAFPPSSITECCRARPLFELVQFAPRLFMKTHNSDFHLLQASPTKSSCSNLFFSRTFQ